MIFRRGVRGTPDYSSSIPAKIIPDGEERKRSIANFQGKEIEGRKLKSLGK